MALSGLGTGTDYTSTTRSLDEILKRRRPDVSTIDLELSSPRYSDSLISEDSVTTPTSGLAQTAVQPGGANLSSEQFQEWMQQQRQGSTPPWLRNTMAIGNLGLGIASFLDGKKTAKIQRDSMRHNLDVAKEEQAQRQAVRDSWNKAWGQS